MIGMRGRFGSRRPCSWSLRVRRRSMQALWDIRWVSVGREERYKYAHDRDVGGCRVGDDQGTDGMGFGLFVV